jgi:signal transduction histidine kinase
LSEGTILFDVGKKNIAAKIYTFDDERRLLLGVDVTKISNDYKRMQLLSLFSIIIMLVVIFTSYLISTFVVTHTNKIAMTAKEIMDTGDLSKRIEVGSRWDDLSYMAQVINQFLDRIEQLMTGIKQVSDNIAHDLRTPLTRIRNSLEQCKESKDVKNISSLNDSLENLINESDQLLNTFNSILKISRVEAAKQKSDFELCDIKGIISDAVEMYSPLIDNKDIALELRLQSYKMLCDKNLLFQAIANIIDNALKFTPQNGAISITSELLDDQFIIRFDDTGPGIDEKEITKVFDRFYRADSSRNTEGSGLGLSLVRAVIELHNGKVALDNRNPGLRIELIFNN